MGQAKESDFPPVLVEFVRRYEEKGLFLCRALPEQVATFFCQHFHAPAPMGFPDASMVVSELEGMDVYLQPGLENKFQIRGQWIAFDGKFIVLIEAGRPDPSKIKTVIHEISEQLLAISHVRHPEIQERSDKEREVWANKVAAYVKMPSEKFKQQVDRLGLDMELLREECDETLAGVSRHIRDLIMSSKSFYFCRFEIVKNPKKHCPQLLDVMEATGGRCVRVEDVVRTAAVRIERRHGAWPTHNLPAFDHFRVLNPALNKYIKENQPVFFSLLIGGNSDEHQYRDLFDDNNISVLIIPFGKRETRGFFLVAVHPSEQHLFAHYLNRKNPDERGELPWLFSWKSFTQKRPHGRLIQLELEGLGDASPLQFQFDQEGYLWPPPRPPFEQPGGLK